MTINDSQCHHWLDNPQASWAPADIRERCIPLIQFKDQPPQAMSESITIWWWMDHSELRQLRWGPKNPLTDQGYDVRCLTMAANCMARLEFQRPDLRSST